MTQGISQEKTILESMKNLTSQQQQEVLDFIEFLQSKNQKVEVSTPEKKPISAYEAAQKWVGCVNSGIGDLSYNKKYLDRPLADSTYTKQQPKMGSSIDRQRFLIKQINSLLGKSTNDSRN